MTAAKKAEAKQPAEEVKQEEQTPEETKPAEEVESAPVQTKQKKHKLKDPSKQYAEGSFTLAGTQEKELPKNPSPELLKRIKAGFIVEVK